MGDEVRKRTGDHVLLLAGRGEGGVALFAAASDRAVKAGVKAGEVLQRVARPLGGKGGGKPAMAQGRLPAALIRRRFAQGLDLIGLIALGLRPGAKRCPAGQGQKYEKARKSL